MKKISVLLLSLLLCVVLIGCSSSDKQSKKQNETAPTETIQATATAETKLEFNIIGGEVGEYGSEITLNAGTELEETRLVYHIPAGTYVVTNKGKNMNQFNVYSDEVTKTDEGWEEPAESVFVKLIDVDSSEEFTITDNQYIYVTDGEWQISKK